MKIGDGIKTVNSRIRLFLLTIIMYLLSGCGHHFVELRSDQFKVSKIEKIELTVEKDQLLVRDSNLIGYLGSPFGYLGVLAAQAVQAGVNRANENELNVVRESSPSYFLKNEIVKQLEELKGAHPFSKSLVVVTEQLDSLLVAVPRLTTKLILAPHKRKLTMIAYVDFQQGQKKAERYFKKYISIHDLREYGLTGNKSEIYKQLSSDPNLLKKILDNAIDDIALIFKTDFAGNKFDEMPSIGSASYIDGDSIYLIDMEIIEEIEGRVLLRGDKMPKRVVMLASKSLLDLK